MENTQKKYVKGVFGTVIGGIIGALPWVLCYIFTNTIYSLLSIFIVIGCFCGYKITKSEIDKKFLSILTIISAIIIILTVYVVIPICLMQKIGIEINFSNFMYLYQNASISATVLQNFFISFLFCGLILAGIILSISKQINDKVDKKEIKIFAKNSLKKYSISTLRTFIIVIVIATVLAFIIIFSGVWDNSLENQNDGNSVEDVYEVGVDNIVLHVPDDMVLLTGEEIANYFSESYMNTYECIAISADYEKMFLLFTDEKSNYETDYTAEEYLKMAMEDDEIPIEEYTFNGHVFYGVTIESENSEGKEFLTTNCVYEAEDKFICLSFYNPKDDTIDMVSVIQ